MRANAVKVLIVLCYTGFALGIFAWHGQVNWGVGLVLALGNMSGAWLGVHLSDREGGARLARGILIAVIVVASAKLLGLVDWLQGLL